METIKYMRDNAYQISLVKPSNFLERARYGNEELLKIDKYGDTNYYSNTQFDGYTRYEVIAGIIDSRWQCQFVRSHGEESKYKKAATDPYIKEMFMLLCDSYPISKDFTVNDMEGGLYSLIFKPHIGEIIDRLGLIIERPDVPGLGSYNMISWNDLSLSLEFCVKDGRMQINPMPIKDYKINGLSFFDVLKYLVGLCYQPYGNYDYGSDPQRI